MNLCQIDANDPGFWGAMNILASGLDKVAGQDSLIIGLTLLNIVLVGCLWASWLVSEKK